MNLPKGVTNPKNISEKLKAKEIALRQQLTKIQQQLDIFWTAESEKCSMYYSRLKEMNTYYTIKKYVYCYHKNFILVGWIPADQEKQFTQGLDKINGIEYTLSDGKDRDKTFSACHS